MSTAIHWFRRDLRIADNTALNAAVAAHDHVVPAYILSGWKQHHDWCGAPRQEFLCGCLASLHHNLESKGGRLILRQGRAADVLEKLVRECGADAIYFNRDPDPFGRATEAQVAQMAARLGVKMIACKDAALHERDEVMTGEGRSFRVFTPYARAWTKLPKAAPSLTLACISVPPAVASEPLPTLAHWGLVSDAQIIAPGESAARKRLSHFLDGPAFTYKQRRDLPAEPGTSRLSQDLRYGTLSIREVFAKCQSLAARSLAEKEGVSTFINELIWREFYMQVLWHHPDVLEHEFQHDTRDLKWRAHWRPEQPWELGDSARDAFHRWCAGQTGFPIVDAGMRQLAATGHVHNRVRMIVAMFLTKDLHIWWMHGESHFMRRLVDGEIASNNGGWQWSASTGTDAAPYFRIQNPWAQTKRFDPTAAYIRQWIPELRDVPATKLCEPPPGLRLVKDYPLPIVDHHVARDHALAMFR